MKSPNKGGSLFELPSDTIAELKAAFNADRYPGPWRKPLTVVHDHPPPLCWGRPDKDCTLRVVTMMERGQSVSTIASRFGIGASALGQRLRDRGVRTQAVKPITPLQRAALQRLRDFGLSLQDIATLVLEHTGHTVSTPTISKHTAKSRAARVQVTLTVSTQCVDALHHLAQKLGVPPGRALEAMVLEHQMHVDTEDEDDAEGQGEAVERAEQGYAGHRREGEE